MNVRNTLILIRFATTRSNIIMQSRFFTDADRCIFPKSPSLIVPGGPGEKQTPGETLPYWSITLVFFTVSHPGYENHVVNTW